MLSEDNHEIKALKTRIAELEQKLEQQWEEENLDSKENFDLNSIYMVITDSGYSAIVATVNAGTIYFFVGGSNYSVSTSNRKTCSAGWAITKIHRKKL
jgi:cell shape-determining protein MreC